MSDFLATVKDIDSLIKNLTKQTNIRPPTLVEKIPKLSFPHRRTKRTQSAFASLLYQYKKGGHNGKFRVGLLVAILLEGDIFLKELEAKGLLLPSAIAPRKFTSMLKDLLDELNENNILEFQVLQRRLTTYINFFLLNELVEDRLVKLDRQLKKRSPYLIKSCLGLAELKFLCKFFQINTDYLHREVKSILDSKETPENFASVVSALIARSHDLSPITPLECEVPIEEGMRSEETKEAIAGAVILQSLHEMAKEISLFGYELHVEKIKKKWVFKLIHPDKDFEYFLRLGYIREDLGRPRASYYLAQLPDFPKISMDTVASSFVSDLQKTMLQWKEYPYPRIVINFPMEKRLWKSLLDSGLFYEDVRYLRELEYEYLVDMRDLTSSFIVPNVLSIEAYMKIGRAIRFFSLVNAHAVKMFCEEKRILSYNSLIRAMKEENLIEFLSVSGASKPEIETFLNLTCWDSKQKVFYDIQYQPLIKKDHVFLMLPSVFATSHLFRNVQVANKIRLRGQSEKFVQLCRSLLERKFNKIVINKKVAIGQRSTDVDIVTLQGTKLYLIECKYSVHPCDPHELRDIWEDILKGVQQLSLAEEILGDPDMRQSYLSGWFPGITRSETQDLEIMTCILTPLRIFAGMTVKNIPIRDVHSFDLILGENEITMSMRESENENKYRIKKYSLVGDQRFSQEDFDDYLSPDSKYFKMFEINMFPVSRISQLIAGEIVVVRDTFVYFIDSDIWSEQMDSLGFRRLSDEEVEVEAPLSKEEFKKLVGRKDGETIRAE
ncbi:MAG: hypothetical protein ABSB10_02705 [Candidatus Bathyarchaeia archaeon]|jgi:hypothetical protein